MAKSFPDDFNFKLVDSFEGYVTSKDKTNVAANVLVRGSKNVYKKDTGTISVRPGLKRLGTADSTFQGITSAFEWDTSLGTQRPIRVLGETETDAADGKLQVMYDGVTEGTWYDLQTALSLTRYVFDSYWDDTLLKDSLLMVRGDSNIYQWGGGITAVDAQAIGGTTLVKADTDTTWAQDGFIDTSQFTADSTTQFDISNQGGNTWRYFYDGTGTDPNINSNTVGIGDTVFINGQNFTAANNGTFVVTGIGADYFEITNASGSADSNVTVGTGSVENITDNKFLIYGSATEYLYAGGVDSSTLTGISPTLPAITADTIVLTPIITHTDKPAAGFINDFIKTINNQLYVGSYSSRLVYISANDDFTNYTIPSPPVDGSPDLLTLDENPKGITVRQGNAHIPAGLFSWYVVSYTQLAIGADIQRQTVVDKQEVAAQTTALAHEFIDTVGDDIIYLDQENQVRVYGIFRNIVQAKYPSISQQIRDELREEDFTGGALRAIGDFVYVTAPISGLTYMHETREAVDGNGNVVAERLWHPPQTWQASRIALIDGVEYVHSAVNPQLYQMWDTLQWHDDSPSDEPLSYNCTMAMSYQQTDRRQGLTAFDKVYYEGYMTEGTLLQSFVLADYQGSSGAANPTINSVESPADFFQGGFSPSLGDSSIGENPLGMGLSDTEESQESLPKFRAITDITQVNCFEYQIVVYSQEVDSRWEILALGPNAQITQNQQAGFLRK